MALFRRTTQLAFAKRPAIALKSSSNVHFGQVRFASVSLTPESLLKKFNPERQRDAPVQKPRLRLHSESGAYAHALFAAAADANAINTVEKELTQMSKLAEQDPNVRTAFANRSSNFPREEFLNEVYQKVGASDITKRFLSFLTTQNQLPLTLELARDFGRLAKSHRREVDAVIISAKELDKPAVDRLTTAMQSRLDKGEKLVVSTRVDPSLIGGMLVKLGETTFDLSLKSEIDQIEKSLLTNINTHFDRLLSQKPKAEFEEPTNLGGDAPSLLEKKYGAAQ